MISKEIKAITFTSLKGVKQAGIFFLEMNLFVTIALVAGFAITVPIYYFGIEYTDAFKYIAFRGLVIGVLFFFISRFVKNYKMEMKTINSSNTPYSGFEKKVRCFIYSTPLLFPKWFKILLYMNLFLAVIAIELLILAKIVFFFMGDSIEPGESSVLETIISFIFKNTVFTQSFWTTILLSLAYIVDLIILITIYQAKGVLEKNHKATFSLIYFAFANFHFILPYPFFIYLLIRAF